MMRLSHPSVTRTNFSSFSSIFSGGMRKELPTAERIVSRYLSQSPPLQPRFAGGRWVATRINNYLKKVFRNKSLCRAHEMLYAMAKKRFVKQKFATPEQNCLLSHPSKQKSIENAFRYVSQSVPDSNHILLFFNGHVSHKVPDGCL